MYRVLLRNIVTGKKGWFDKCYLNGKLERNKIVFWQGPDDNSKQKYKIISWQWQGFDKFKSPKEVAIEKYAQKALLSLDIPAEWREELLKYST